MRTSRSLVFLRLAASLLIPSSGYADLYIPTFPVSITSRERKLTASPTSRMLPGSLADECCREQLAAWIEHGYSITWSAWRRSVDGIVSPKVVAAFWLTVR
jgi:hypothetical protein